MGFLQGDGLAQFFRRGKPGGGGGFAEMTVLGRAEIGTQRHREEVLPAIVIPDRLDTDFMRDSILNDRADDPGGVNECVDHGERFPFRDQIVMVDPSNFVKENPSKVSLVSVL